MTKVNLVENTRYKIKTIYNEGFVGLITKKYPTPFGYYYQLKLDQNGYKNIREEEIKIALLLKEVGNV